MTSTADRALYSPDEPAAQVTPEQPAEKGASAEGDAPAADDLGTTALGDAKVEGEGEAAKEGEDADKAKEGNTDEQEKAKEGDDAKADAETPALDLTALKAPEGYEGLDAELVEAAKPLLTKLGVKDVEQAQEVLNEATSTLITPLITKAVEAGQASVFDAVREQRQEWLTESKAHPELGAGKVTNWDNTLRDCARFVDTYGGKQVIGEDGKPMVTKGGQPYTELRLMLDKTGLGNNPALMLAFAKAGRELAEHSTVRSDAAGQSKGRVEDQFFHRTAKA